MIEIDESKKLDRFKVLKLDILKKVFRIYEIKKGTNVLIYCDTGSRKSKVSPRLGKTFYTELKKLGCNVSIIVGREAKKVSYAPKNINDAFFSLKKGEVLVSLPSNMVPFYHKNKKRVLGSIELKERKFRIISTSGIGSLAERDAKKFFESYDHDEKKMKILNAKIVRAMKKTDEIRITCA